MSRTSTFVSACLAGEALITDIDDWVDAWHDAEDSHGESLAEALGFTEEEYALWVERPEALRFILAANRAGQSDTSGIPEVMAVAARASHDAEAASVLEWLEKMGRVG